MSFYTFLALACICIPTAIKASNIVLILTDDQDVTLGGMTPLNRTQELIGNEGSVYSNCFVNTPVCCPNRASILTGLCQHNHGTVNNSVSGDCASVRWQENHEPNTFAAILKNKLNYTTFYAGKYLNQYGTTAAGGTSHVPTGWDWWAGMVGNSKYYNYTISINGTGVVHKDQPEDYLTDVVANLGLEFLKTRNPNDANNFLMVLAPPAPHAPFVPAPRHIDAYKGTQALRTENFNTPRQTEKHWLIGYGDSPLPDDVLPKLDDIYRNRWETLLTVDELVENTYKALSDRGLLDDTYIIFTSDNGYHVGQFAMPLDKRQPYETDIRVPLLIRGPGIAVGTVEEPVSTIDLFATILAMAGTSASSDGTSILSDCLSSSRTFLIEYVGERSEVQATTGCPSDSDINMSWCRADLDCKCQDTANNTYNCLRRFSEEANDLFCVFMDNINYVEAYNLTSDAFQMTNIASTMDSDVRAELEATLETALQCNGTSCVVASI